MEMEQAESKYCNSLHRYVFDKVACNLGFIIQ